MTLDDIRHFDLRSINLRDIDVSAAGEWPPAGKAVAIILVGILLLIAGYYFVISKTLEDLKGREQAEQQLRQQFVTKYRQAVNLEAYRDSWRSSRRVSRRCGGSCRTATRSPTCWWR